jgi:hypothetical protein
MKVEPHLAAAAALAALAAGYTFYALPKGSAFADPQADKPAARTSIFPERPREAAEALPYQRPDGTELVARPTDWGRPNGSIAGSDASMGTAPLPAINASNDGRLSGFGRGNQGLVRVEELSEPAANH